MNKTLSRLSAALMMIGMISFGMLPIAYPELVEGIALISFGMITFGLIGICKFESIK